jgi:hypothetical protein
VYEFATRRVYVGVEVQWLPKVFRSVQAGEFPVILENAPVSEVGEKLSTRTIATIVVELENMLRQTAPRQSKIVVCY